MSKAVKDLGMGIVEPAKRLQLLSNYGNLIQIDANLPVTRYYRSGTEMLRMANVYLNEGNHENAFILYMKYMTLFIEKIRAHPDYGSIKSEVKVINKKIKDEIMPTTEKLRAKLLDRYQREYEQFLASKEAEKARELERERQRQKRDATNASANLTAEDLKKLVKVDPGVQPSAPDMNLLEQVVYPNDFPTGTHRSQIPSAGLLLPNDKDNEESKPNNLTIKLPPSFDRSQKPAYDRSDSLMAGQLRSIVVPKNTMDVFLQLALNNTKQNIETCGILAGHLEHNKLFITHIIVPKQQGTADSCHTMNEEEIFDVQDQRNLITLGWIHTHPSQTAFLSSVDLHTHCSYQIMMPEAIAIVCAPKYNTSGFFILTPNYGLDYIAQCHLGTGFHPHPNEPPLYTEAPHVLMDATHSIEVVDLRR